MAKKTQRQLGKKSARADSVSDDNNLDSDTDDDLDFGELWLADTLKSRDRSRIQRQMKARRELERRQDEKRLKNLVDDWYFDENY